jgi:nitrogen regulatory protein PII
MKLVMIICDGERVDDVRDLLESHGVNAFTEVPGLHGAGDTGAHRGTRAFPGSSTLVFTAVADESAAGLIETLRRFSATCRPDEPFSVFSLKAEEVI